MNRRQCLVQAMGLTLSPALLAAAPARAPRTLVVFLRGACDGLSVLSPLDSDDYREARPQIAIPRAQGGQPGSQALDADWGLHPAVWQHLEPLWRQRQLAFVPFAGMPDPSRSHFEMQDKMELGQGSQPRDYRSGFLARLLAETQGRKAAAFTRQVPLVLSGPVTWPNIPLATRGRAHGLDTRTQDLMREMYQRQPEGRLAAEALENRAMAADLAQEMDAADRQAVSPGSFTAAADRIGRMMLERFQVGFVDVGRWDTHVSQGAVTGQLADRLADLSSGLQRLSATLGSAWADTVVIVISEFGRTFKENGNRGTDHGHGGLIWLLGGGLHGGRVAGEQVPVRWRHLHEQRDLPVLNDYRQVLGGVLARQHGLDAAAASRLFPGTRPLDLSLL
ncbi:DUF1501 domain-containing protein [Ideonella sp. TBM-1]|uniref:DUF1501 domain-containing protein n=1 Tax=Ideonella livida TaxID=2707176 RepID=A0A7C9PG47_9BURK|nr:DUF1501 domain-containing protein [Ideonella livida]